MRGVPDRIFGRGFVNGVSGDLMKTGNPYLSGVVLAGLFAVSAVYGDAGTDLSERVFKTAGFSADFVQTVKSGDGKVLQESRGEMSLLRPEFFRMEISEPDESLLVADGKAVYSYDPLLEQVVIYSFDREVGNSPLMLLVSPDKKVWDRYRIESRGKDAFKVTLREPGGLVTEMEILFQGDSISKLNVYETDGKVSTYDFVSVSAGAPEKKDFRFDIPEGVTVDDQRGK